MNFSLTAFQWPPFITGLLAMLVVLAFGLLAVRNVSTAVPSGAQNLLESALETFQDLVGQMAPKELAPNLTLLSLTLFLLLVVANVLGLLPLPGIGTRWIHSPTAFLSMPAGLAIVIFLLIQWSGIKYKGLGGFLIGWFWKPIPVFGFIVNALEQLVMPVSLAFRLFGNILAGELVLRMTTNLPHDAAGWLVVVLVGTLWLVFSLVISLIQALIFTILTVAYMSIQASSEH
ncbi:F0F1 ATP synthase subunit A [Sulfobacillus thermosulfidooxidans]|uniref:F0F1 ATP synthase subunit A n=1 Tax=Sulfobacillus thermosulfidooxidans TaxID=28034 RepID=UPI0002E0FEE2|nr:F0F1 ATP synthase subunit A [Sulfobacillus thermosulfidooxidans]OLZ10664.1 ATP synthase F0 subunit A [Sulfobacillus thermosulfidooxidans]OLZ17555.1 ATP synthase F0 subunit A [Sulfobacillus thermosulfidooxidans]OLZ20881.1 ATP synthase F0 subunit A [Sulfobacillus thermosulfidooxidans]